jgi:hypothetical protein
MEWKKYPAISQGPWTLKPNRTRSAMMAPFKKMFSGKSHTVIEKPAMQATA